MKKSIGMILLAVLLFAAGCSNGTKQGEVGNSPSASSPSSQQPTPQETAGKQDEADHDHDDDQELVVVGQEIAATLDPVQPLTSAYLRNIGAAEALFKVNAEGEIVPELASEAKMIDVNTWEIKLQPDVRFWSGKAMDVDAVIASLERSREVDVQAQPFLEGLTFTKQDATTLRVVSEQANAPVPLNLSYYQTVIHNTEAAHDAVNTTDMTGMYKIVDFAPKQHMTLVRNETYWGTMPSIGKVVFEEIAEEQTRVLSLLSGSSQIALNISPASLAKFEQNSGAEISLSPAANTQTIYLNLRQPQLADERVRQALSWGLDRDELVLLGAEGQSVPVTTWLSSNPAYAEARQSVYTSADAAKAGELLDEAGWVMTGDGLRYKDGKPLTVKLMTWGGDKALGEAIQHQWTKLGIKAEVNYGDYSLIEAARKSGDWDASIEAWSTFGDEYALLAGQFSADGRGNYGGYKDVDTEEMLGQLAAAADQAERHKLALRINEHVAEQAPVISLYPRPQLTAISKSLEGFTPHFRQFENTVQAGLRLIAK